MKYVVTVRGHQHEWGIRVPEIMVEGLREDGFEVLEVVNTIPAWAVDAGIGWAWMMAQDLWDMPSRVWRKIRGRK
jgi:hypothetical protein